MPQNFGSINSQVIFLVGGGGDDIIFDVGWNLICPSSLNRVTTVWDINTSTAQRLQATLMHLHTCVPTPTGSAPHTTTGSVSHIPPAFCLAHFACAPCATTPFLQISILGTINDVTDECNFQIDCWGPKKNLQTICYSVIHPCAVCLRIHKHVLNLCQINDTQYKYITTM